MASRSKILGLYKQMMKESKKFSNYNFREYAIRRVRDGFKEGKVETEPTRVSELVKFAEDQLAVITRQATVGQLYQENAMVLEAKKK